MVETQRLESCSAADQWPLAVLLLISDLSTSNLRYLTSEQALADFAAFITDYRDRHPEVASSAWISFGGSYSGSLSAWLRYRTSSLSLMIDSHSRPTCFRDAG